MLTPHAAKHYAEQDTLSFRCGVARCDATRFYVTYMQSAAPKRRCVDLEARTCTCLRWHQRQMPCHHAIAAARADGRTATNLKEWYEWAIHAMYFAKNYRDTYKEKSVQLPTIEDIAPDGQTKKAHFVKQAGRPRKKRIRSAGGRVGDGAAPRKKVTCQICGEKGHNRTTCQRQTM